MLVCEQCLSGFFFSNSWLINRCWTVWQPWMFSWELCMMSIYIMELCSQSFFFSMSFFCVCLSFFFPWVCLQSVQEKQELFSSHCKLYMFCFIAMLSCAGVYVTLLYSLCVSNTPLPRLPNHYYDYKELIVHAHMCMTLDES